MKLWLLPLAWCSEPLDPLDYVPGSFNVRDTPIREVMERSAVVVEGELVAVLDDIWLGPTGAYTKLIWRIRVEEELLGHVESGYVDLSIEDMWPPRLRIGERVLVMAGPQTLGAPVSEHGVDALESYPAYGDLMVPTAYGSLYYTRMISFPERAEQWGSTRNQDVPWLQPASAYRSWADLVAHAREEASSCSPCGATVPGASVDGVQ